MKKFLSLIAFTLTALIFSVNISAEEVDWYNKEDIENFVNLFSTDRNSALEYKANTMDGDSGDDIYTLTDEELELLKNKKEYVLTADIENNGSYPNNMYFFEFYTSDYKVYAYKHDFTQRNILTVQEILEESGIKDSEKLICGVIRYFDCPPIKDYSFAEYKTGWNTIDGNKYFVKQDGTLVTKSCKIGGVRYKFTADGICRGRYTGWTKSAKGRRYWKNGELVTEKYIRTKSGKRYYADKDGYVTEV